jgi:hypothetical protein
MVSAAIACRDVVHADELVDALDGVAMRDRVRVEIAAVAAETGQEGVAASVIDRIRKAEERGWALAAATGAGVILPLLDDVESIARSVPDADARLELLTSLVEVMASVGRVVQAEDLIRTTSEPEHRGLAWAALAENLRGDPARSAVALSLRWGRWTTALRRLARLEPAALRGVEAEFFVLNPDSPAC